MPLMRDLKPRQTCTLKLKKVNGRKSKLRLKRLGSKWSKTSELITSFLVSKDEQELKN
jgi:hypothetical protein